MAKQSVNIGIVANDHKGDPLRTAFDKCNDNFTEVYDAAVEPDYFYFSGRTLRIGKRNSEMVFDQVVNPGGFDQPGGGTEGIDWVQLNSFVKP